MPRFLTVGTSEAEDPVAAVAEATAGVDISATCFVLAFLPQRLAPEIVASELARVLRGVPVFGCSTAGQITMKGYETDALLVLCFPREHFRCSSILFDSLAPVAETRIASLAQRQSEQFSHTAGWNRLAFLFTDGLSKQEDLLASILDTALDGCPVFGGSAGDGFRFETTYILSHGTAHTNAAVLLLVETDLEYQGLGFDHFLPSGPKVIITGADPEERIVHEINGVPAAEEYARFVGCPVEQLSPEVFAEFPLLLRHNNKFYVRAVHGITETNAMSFLAAIDDGLILTLGRGKEVLRTLELGLDVQNGKGEAPDFIIGFDCGLRKLEFQQKQLEREVSRRLAAHRVLGFNTYGEQQSGVHMNQTFVGVAFFEPEPMALHP